MAVAVVSADEAVERIPDGATLTISGNGSLLQPEGLLRALERRFLATGRPRGLELYYPVVTGTGPGTGVDRLAHPGMLRGVVASCFDIWGIDGLARRIRAADLAAHCVPMGVMFQLLHAAADGQPGILSRVGLGTFVDPAVRGTAQNDVSGPSRARRVDIGGQVHLFYEAPAVGAAIIRASVADEDGNLSLYREPIRQAVLTMALAARAGRGPVLAEVQALVRRGTLPADRVDIPGFLVDALVVDPSAQQSSVREYDPALTGEWDMASPPAPLPPGPDRVVARRAALELRPGMVVNLGFGLAALVARIAAEEGVADDLTLSVEHGPLGGMPTGLETFGAAVSPRCILRSADVFALYHTGQLDAAILSAAEVDAAGDANVSRFGDKMPGPGGYIDITGCTPRLILLCALTAGARLQVEGPALRVAAEGSVRRFVSRVRERTFSAAAAVERGASVRYVTDRCTFDLTPRGLMLSEVAPGIDPRRDVLERMDFRPAVAEPLGRWPASPFAPGPMGLREAWAARSAGSAT